MVTKIFNWFDGWRTEILTCPKCGWKGTFEDGQIEIYDELWDSTCPVCNVRDPFNAPMLAIVSYPTIEEYEANWDKLSESEKNHVKKWKKFHSDWELAKLKTEINLPDLAGESLTLTWDFEFAEDSTPITVIKHGEREIWRELACYEGFRRYEEIVDILKKKYGPRLADVAPTEVSKTYLYGDKFLSIDVVKKVRESLKDAHESWLSGNKCEGKE